MQIVVQVLRAVWDGIVRVFRFWQADIAKRQTLIGKLASISVGLFLLCCVCGTLGAATQSAGERIGILPTRTPTLTPSIVPTREPTATSAPTSTPEPTAVPSPEPTSAPTEVPANTPEPTLEPIIAEPTAEPAPENRDPTFLNDRVDPPWWPCTRGQMKGNRNSGIYHAPDQRDYSKTHKNVACFDTESAAVAGGYRKAQR